MDAARLEGKSNRYFLLIWSRSFLLFFHNHFTEHLSKNFLPRMYPKPFPQAVRKINFPFRRCSNLRFFIAHCSIPSSAGCKLSAGMIPISM